MSRPINKIIWAYDKIEKNYGIHFGLADKFLFRKIVLNDLKHFYDFYTNSNILFFNKFNYSSKKLEKVKKEIQEQEKNFADYVLERETEKRQSA